MKCESKMLCLTKEECENKVVEVRTVKLPRLPFNFPFDEKTEFEEWVFGLCEEHKLKLKQETNVSLRYNYEDI